MNLMLIGYRGTGKTVVGRLLSVRLGMTYVGLDAGIAEVLGRRTPRYSAAAPRDTTSSARRSCRFFEDRLAAFPG